jgi:alkanesulfonate monooxygenase SsuD/methylene tetrahydromethanopterin reductase-like flavin-dependent oxidoreductase (luciferase family)
MDECLTVLRQLLTGQPTTFHGRHVSVDEAVILPAPSHTDPDAGRRPVGRGGAAGGAARRRLARHLGLRASLR